MMQSRVLRKACEQLARRSELFDVCVDGTDNGLNGHPFMLMPNIPEVNLSKQATEPRNADLEVFIVDGEKLAC